MLQFNPSILAKMQIFERANRAAAVSQASRALSTLKAAEKSASVLASRIVARRVGTANFLTFGNYIPYTK